MLDRSAVTARADMVAPSAESLPATSWPMPPRPTTSTRHLRDLSHLPATRPVAISLLSQQPRQILRAGQDTEDRELRQRSCRAHRRMS